MPHRQELLDFLAAARHRVETGWCQHAGARSGPKAVLPEDPTADRWCMSGALLCEEGLRGFSTTLATVGSTTYPIRTFDDRTMRLRLAAERYLARSLRSIEHTATLPALTLWNDRSGRTQDEVLAAFDTAAALVSADAHLDITYGSAIPPEDRIPKSPAGVS